MQFNSKSPANKIKLIHEHKKKYLVSSLEIYSIQYFMCNGFYNNFLSLDAYEKSIDDFYSLYKVITCVN